MSVNIEQELERLGEEARRAAEDARAEAERIRKAPVSAEQLRAFAASRRARFWQMPVWLWAPIVASLVALLALGLYVGVM